MGSPGSRQGDERGAFRPAKLARDAHFLPGIAVSQFAKMQLVQLVSRRATVARGLRSKV
jgi:hypothetical protein